MNGYCVRCGAWRRVTGYCGLCEPCMTVWQVTHARGLSLRGGEHL
jgi:hypothetical protein